MSRHGAVQVENRVSGLARAVAARRATIVAVVAFGLEVAVSRHWLTPDWSGEVTRWVQDGLAAATVVGAGAWIHHGTTPADQTLQPRNSLGQDLVPDPSAADALTADESAGDAAAALDDPTGGAAGQVPVYQTISSPPPEQPGQFPASGDRALGDRALA